MIWSAKCRMSESCSIHSWGPWQLLFSLWLSAAWRMAMPFYECRRCKNVHLLLLLFFISSVGIFPRDLRKKIEKTNKWIRYSVRAVYHHHHHHHRCCCCCCCCCSNSILTSCAGGRHNMPRPLQVDHWPFDLESDVRVTCDVGYVFANFSLPRPLCSRLRPDVYAPDVRRPHCRQMSDAHHRLMPLP